MMMMMVVDDEMDSALMFEESDGTSGTVDHCLW